MFWRGGRIGPRSNAFRCGKGREMGGGGGHNSRSSTITGNHYLTDAAVDSIGRHVFVFVPIRAISSLLSFFLLFYLLFSFSFSLREKERICTIKVIAMKARRRGKSSSLSAIL